MLGDKTTEQWVAQYASSHQHPVNRFCHTLGIPLIAASLPLFVVAALRHAWWPLPVAMFVVGWILQFLGHFIEGNQPAFFRNPVYLLVGPLWLARRALSAVGLSKTSAASNHRTRSN